MRFNGGAKVPYVFISREKFNFCLFWTKIEWVSEKCVFFFSTAVFFFFGSLRMSEWVKCELFLGKKNTKKCWKKKIHDQNSIMFENCLIYLFLTFFCRYYFFFEWVAFKLFLGKKIQLYFFSGKKNTKFSQIEWVSGVQTFPGKKKKYDTFGYGHFISKFGIMRETK